MAIYSINVTPIGRSTHAAGTAGAHVGYITRSSAAVAVMAERMPIARPGSRGGKARRWLDEQESGDRKNGRVVTKFMLALPHELTDEQRAELVRSFAERMTAGRASWLAAIHRPDEQGDPRNHHAHLVIRDKDPETGKVVVGLSAKNSVDLIREEWERAVNAALEAAGFEERVDRRSLKAQGIDRVPSQHVGPVVTAIERRGEHSYVRDRIEAEQIAREEAADVAAQEAEEARRAAQEAEEARRAAQEAEEARRAAQEAEEARRAAQEAEEARRAAQAREQDKFRREVEADADLIEREGGYLVAKRKWEKNGGLRIFVEQLPEFEQYAKPCRDAENRVTVLEKEISQAQQRIARAETDEAEWKAEHPWKALIDLAPEPIQQAREQVKRDRIAIEEKHGLLAVVKESLTKLVGAFRKFFADALERPDIKRRGMVREKALEVAQERWRRQVQAEQAVKREQEAQQRQAEQERKQQEAIVAFKSARELVLGGVLEVAKRKGEIDWGWGDKKTLPIVMADIEKIKNLFGKLSDQQKFDLFRLYNELGGSKKQVEVEKPAPAADEDFDFGWDNGPGM